NINLRTLLRLIHKNDILGKFELINHGHLHLSPYFSVIGTVLIKIISHRTLTTDDLCIFSRILQDDIINKTTSNWSILKDFIQLFRSILHTEFVKNIYFELINDEQELTKSHDGIRFEGKKRNIIDNTIEEVIEKRGLPFANLSTCYSAITCFNRTIVINKNIIILELIDDEKRFTDNSIMFGGLLVIMLQRAFNAFYEQTPPGEVLSRNNMEMADGGTQLEDRLFGIAYESIGYFGAEFLLNYQNWINHNHEEFKEKFKDIRMHDLLENTKHNRCNIPCKGRTIYDDIEIISPEPESQPTTCSRRWRNPQCAMAAPFFRYEQ
ncbi:unnamed protein product, partial [Rotaria magnacalcarata]